MFCNNCHKNLEEFDSVIEKMTNCPHCGGVLIKAPKEVPQESFDTFCSRLTEKCGIEVFASDLSLIQNLENVEPCFYDARDKMSLLTIKQIPSRLYAAKYFPKDETANIINQCQKQLVINLGVSFDTSKEMLVALQKSIFGKEISVPALFTGDSFIDSRDGNIYRTVKIGDQIWMAENLRYKCDNCYTFGSDYSYWAKYGYLYNSGALDSIAPNGWHVPTQSDFDKLFAFATRTHKGLDWHKCLLANDEAWNDEKGTDEFGFSALPGGRYENGYKDMGLLACFWSAESTVCTFSTYRCYWGGASEAYIRLIKNDN